MTLADTIAPKGLGFQSHVNQVVRAGQFALAAVRSGLSRTVALYRNRRTFGRMAEMSHAELADIGLTRADIVFAGNLPLGSDPTGALARLADDRRRHHHRSGLG